VIDSGLFHVFSDEDRRCYVEGLATVLRPGGRLFLLCFSDEEPGTPVPRRVSKRELHDAFAEGCSVESIEPLRFEVRPDLKEAGKEDETHDEKEAPEDAFASLGLLVIDCSAFDPHSAANQIATTIATGSDCYKLQST
jgi:hypothetical protein